ncbi:hypothetical protein PVK06_023743 [Gossypium arboreum]|uniref:Reverse transcriptase domain-containing protein n=1 Tax=Gossypium arboreum TaxID=29729 RepID=A0ABR0PC73_GOSAR|nr:hypothetical protein PVK06_023743 [Gossypium arboreum]
MLGKMGFSDGWIEMVMKYVESVSYLVVFNGKVEESFQPSHGLRQGDPLSTYLFRTCSEDLSTLLRATSMQSRLKGIRINRYALTVTHLLFADDSMIFVEALLKGF